MDENITCKVSVLCATYNHEEYLRQTLDSFLNQKTDFPFEVLVNDDASTYPGIRGEIPRGDPAVLSEGEPLFPAH